MYESLYVLNATNWQSNDMGMSYILCTHGGFPPHKDVETQNM
jgi:hypothetical protein